MSNWSQGLGDIGKLPVSSRYLRGSDVYVGDNSLLLDALHRGGAVVVRLYYEVAHYVRCLPVSKMDRSCSLIRITRRFHLQNQTRKRRFL
ncbi:MAG: hypothetical protein ACLTR6_09495 [Clostridium fessum]